MATRTVNVNVNTLGFTKEKLEQITQALIGMANNSGQSYKTIMENFEMANMTNKLNEEKRTGIVKGSQIVLDQEFNGAISWRVPKQWENKIYVGSKVNVVFQDKQIVSISTYEVPITSEPVKHFKRQIPEHGFYVTPDQKEVLDIASKAFHDDSNPYKGFVIAFKGDAGYGKTSLAQYFSHENKLPLLIIDCSTIPDNEGWFVVPGFKNHETVFDKTKFTDFLERGNCAILFDEINRMPTWVSNALLPILDHRRSTNVRGLEIQANNKIAFFMTSNEGVAYGGTNPIDKALKRRTIGYIQVGALPYEVETELLETRMGLSTAQAENIVKTFTRLRGSPLKEYPVNISTGTSLNVAWWVKYGASIRKAFEVAVLNDAPEESKKIILESLSILGNM